MVVTEKPVDIDSIRARWSVETRQLGILIAIVRNAWAELSNWMEPVRVERFRQRTHDGVTLTSCGPQESGRLVGAVHVERVVERIVDEFAEE